MSNRQDTQVTTLRVRTRRTLSAAQEAQTPTVAWEQPVKKRPGEALLKNLAMSAALVLCAVTLRTGALPSMSETSDVIMTAATDDSLLDDQLGKLSFVSALFPEAVLVFGEQRAEQLSLPISNGDVVHTWSEAEPYMAWAASGETVLAAGAGEVIGVYHGNGDERLVQVLGSDGLACLYGNLAEVHVEIGDHVSPGETLGTLIPGEACVLEVRRDGMSLDPALYLPR